MDTSSRIRVYGVLGRGGAVCKNSRSASRGCDRDSKASVQKDRDDVESGTNEICTDIGSVMCGSERDLPQVPSTATSFNVTEIQKDSGYQTNEGVHKDDGSVACGSGGETVDDPQASDRNERDDFGSQTNGGTGARGQSSSIGRRPFGRGGFSGGQLHESKQQESRSSLLPSGWGRSSSFTQQDVSCASKEAGNSANAAFGRDGFSGRGPVANNDRGASRQTFGRGGFSGAGNQQCESSSCSFGQNGSSSRQGFAGRGGFSGNIQNVTGDSSRPFSRGGGSSGSQVLHFGRGGFSSNQNNDSSFNNVKSQGFGNNESCGGAGFGNNRNNNNTGERGQREGGGFRRFDRDFSNMNQNDSQKRRNIFDEKSENGQTDERPYWPRPCGYIPPIRPIKELVKEDVDNAENYRMVLEDDEDVIIMQNGINIVDVTLDSWESANFEPKLLKNIFESKYVRPRKIQAKTIPIILEGRDIKAQAETGSGKTAAFMLPLINMIMKIDRRREPLSGPTPYAIIIDPTRELSSQVYDQGRKFAKDTGVTVGRAYGQYDITYNGRELVNGCDILCATPGRLLHFIAKDFIELNCLKYLVLDEADRLLEFNFLSTIRMIINYSGFPQRQNRQTLLFSATFPDEIVKLSEKVLKSGTSMISNKDLIAASAKVMQSFISVPKDRKKQALLDILEKNIKMAVKEKRIHRTLVFVQRRREADLLSLWLSQQNVKATTINGDREQGQREKALKDFRDGGAYVLVSTDVCARGIDIKDVDHVSLLEVINYDLPDDHVIYVHRVGRTGRVKDGYATSFFDENYDSDIRLAHELVKFLRNLNQDVPEFLERIASENPPNRESTVAPSVL